MLLYFVIFGTRISWVAVRCDGRARISCCQLAFREWIVYFTILPNNWQVRVLAVVSTTLL